ncbi:MAG: hypothetical protein PHU07_13205, partial [Acidocella sp.]|nr:hypothetical protein [Acidocella sp.]
MTNSATRSRITEISERAAEIKGESLWKSELADLARVQSEEIDRLNAALADAGSVPVRRPMLATIGSTTMTNGVARDAILVIDDSGTLWLNSEATRGGSWTRLPDLPAPAEIAKTLETPRELAEKQAAAEAKAREAEMARVNGWRRS